MRCTDLFDNFCIPVDFHSQPVFNFQLYVTVPVDLDELSTHTDESDDTERLLLHDLLDYVNLLVADEAQRPEPIWDIYTNQRGAIECVARELCLVDSRSGEAKVEE